MDSLSRYHLSVREDGLWNVIDSLTGGPAEVEFGGNYVLLFKLTKEMAEAWSERLNAGARLAFPGKHNM